MSLTKLAATGTPVGLAAVVLAESAFIVAQAGDDPAPLAIHPAFLAGVAAVLGALALVLKVLPGAFRGGAGEAGRDMARTLALVERQQDQLQKVTELLEAQHDTAADDRAMMAQVGKSLSRVAESFDRALDRLTGLTLETEQMQQDMRAHDQAAKIGRDQIAELHRHILRGKGRQP
jgi:hypothetical protein